jgi:crotonobetainyl-CoA:carnitine CoA-transferase CaiB-like acyl-CoA transferase
MDADVLVENNRPGAMERLGLGAAYFLQHKPSLVYCSISAFGQSGPRSAEGGFDLTVQAAAGVMSVTGTPHGEPVKCGVPISDFTAGLYGALAISAMLVRVRAGGPGGHIDVPMFATTLAISALQTSQYFGTGTNPERLGSAHPRNAPYKAFQARDGWFAIAAGNNKLWASVCDVLGRDDLQADKRFATTTLRATHQDALHAILEPHFAAESVDYWLKQFAARGVPSAPINTYSQALADPQSIHLGLVTRMQLPNGQSTETVGSPLWIDGQPIELNTRPPALGEHSENLRVATIRQETSGA